VRIRWRFAPTAHSTHTFVLKYLARGVVRQQGGADLLAWEALPRQHAYRIASSTIDLRLPAGPLEPPSVSTRRGRAESVDHDDGRVRIVTQDLRSNGSVHVQVRFPAGAVISDPPEWQARQLRAAERGPRWLTAAGVTLAVCCVLLFALRQNYDAPLREASSPVSGLTRPDDLPPTVAGALATDGWPRVEHAIATLISLADRGEITITAEPRGFLGQRDFTLRRAPGAAPLAGYEQTVVDTVFAGRDGLKESVKLSAAHSVLALRSGRFKRALDQHLLESGLMDEARKAVRDRYGFVAGLLMVLGLAGLVGGIVALRGEHGPWPLAVPAALIVAAIIALIFHHATTALSNEGLRRGNAWRAYRRYLRSVARERAPLPGPSASRLLPFAVAFGLAAAWAKYAEHVSAAVPPWFQSGTDSRAFPVFVASAGAGSSGGGAAGGGASGAG
jgi:hypothetical protein